MIKNLYINLEDEEFLEIVKGVLNAKEEGTRLEPLVPYAKEIQKQLDHLVTLNNCLDITYYDFIRELMKRFIEKSELK